MIILIINITCLQVIRGDYQFYIMRGTHDVTVIWQEFSFDTSTTILFIHWRHND